MSDSTRSVTKNVRNENRMLGTSRTMPDSLATPKGKDRKITDRKIEQIRPLRQTQPNHIFLSVIFLSCFACALMSLWYRSLAATSSPRITRRGERAAEGLRRTTQGSTAGDVVAARAGFILDAIKK